MASNKTGRIVWHDLFTDDASLSRSFYEQVAGWQYVVERAQDFAWGGGERDFILALLDGEAGAGLIERNDAGASGWVPYVEVEDVDATVRIAVDLHGTVVKAPFEVAGVGRNCLLRDPKGALFGISLSRHEFPAPTRQFGPEVYTAGEFPEDFYECLFGWSTASVSDGQGTGQSILQAGNPIGFCIRSEGTPAWIPGIKIAGELSEALRCVEEWGGSVVQPEDLPQQAGSALAADSNGSRFYLVTG